MLGITEMMRAFHLRFGRTYAPNTRETVRRHTVHQFIQLGLVVANPDDPSRPVNSPANRYQAVPTLVALARTYGTRAWKARLAAFVQGTKTLSRLRSKERAMRLVPVNLPHGGTLMLTPGGQNQLLKKVVEEFCPRFTPGGVLVYLGDAGREGRHLTPGYLERLGVTRDAHGKMPDIVVHFTAKNWLVLIEAVASHGPIGLKRHNELKAIFGAADAGLVFVTAFLSRGALMKHVREIAWETEVWIADSPSHVIHFDGERFLGPYGSGERASKGAAC